MDAIWEEIKSLSFLEIIGALTIILGFFKLLFEVIPKFKNFKDFLISYSASKFKYAKLERKAIKNDIEKVVNDVVIDVRKELPVGWIRKVVIKWVSKEQVVNLEEDQMIIKIKPMENQDYNLINGVFHCIKSSLFPDLNGVIPNNVHNSASMYLTKRALITHHPFIKEKFETKIVEPSILTDSTIAELYGKFEEMDKEGYFTGTFIREVYHIAETARYNENRSHIENEIREILSHIRNFQTKKIRGDEEIWYRRGLISSYGFIKVALPSHSNVKTYVNRALKRFNRGISRLYILGCNQERSFAKKVIKGIANLPQYKLIELYELNKDYRGEKGGVGALLITEISNNDTEEFIDNFFEGTK